ncbi:hypothetical protein MJK71_26650 [Escherichia coli]|nr:hypothetical protein MJK71_26650 [Escherichia coli]
MFGKFTGATEAETLKTWTMMETILGTVGAIVGMIAFQLLGLVCSPGSCDATGFFSASPRYPLHPHSNAVEEHLGCHHPAESIPSGVQVRSPLSHGRRKNSEDCSRMMSAAQTWRQSNQPDAPSDSGTDETTSAWRE